MSKEQSEKSFLDKTREQLGIDQITVDGHNIVFEYFQKPYADLRLMTNDELCEIMHVLSRYVLHLRVELGSAKAKLSAVEDQYNHDMHAEAATFTRAVSLEERKALAVRNSDELKDLQDIARKQRMVVNQVEPVVWGIDNQCKRLETMIRNRGERSGGV
jgi:hypothetical protein